MNNKYQPTREGLEYTTGWYDNGVLREEEYRFSYDKRHRENGPARIFYFPSGKVMHKIWYNMGKPHRKNGPAVIAYYENESIKYKKWVHNDQYYRDGDRPAYISYHKNGRINQLKWFHGGVEHRTNKPAVLTFNEKGKIIEMEYWWDGHMINDAIEKIVKPIPSKLTVSQHVLIKLHWTPNDNV